MGVTTNYPKWFIWVNLRVENAFKDGHFDRGVKPIFNGENAGEYTHFKKHPIEPVWKWRGSMSGWYPPLSCSIPMGDISSKVPVWCVSPFKKRPHSQMCLQHPHFLHMKFHCRLRISCRKTWKNHMFWITLQQDKMDMEVIPSFKHTLAVLGLVGLEVYSHRKRIKDIWSSRVFMGFPYVFPRVSVNFPRFSICWRQQFFTRRSIQRLLWSRSSQRWLSNNWMIEGVQLGLLHGYSHSGYQRMVIPCYTIVSYWTYSWFLPISGGYSMSYCNYSNNPYKSRENPPDCSCIPTYFTGIAPSRDWEGHHFKK